MMDKLEKELEKLKQKLNSTLEENKELRKQLKNMPTPRAEDIVDPSKIDAECTTVSVPETFQPIFLKAQEYVKHYFQNKVANPEQGTIDINNERYILIRAASMSKEFYETIFSHYQDRSKDDARRVASGFLFDLANSLGKADAKSFHTKMNVTDPIEKLSAGPIHFSYTGWAFVEILEESNPTPDENYYLIYDHPFSFEADVWMSEKKKTDFPVCVMNCGYSSGWCEESFGIPLVAVEVECQARGDKHCRFIMAPPSKIESYIIKYQAQPYRESYTRNVIEIPEIFQRKRLEDKLRRSEETARALLNAPTESALLLDVHGNVLALNKTAAKRLGKPETELIGKNIFNLFPSDLRERRLQFHQYTIKTKQPIQYIDQRDNRWADTKVYPILDPSGKVVRIAVYSRDISEFKKNEEELKHHRHHLEELVTGQTSELRSANLKLTSEIAERKRIEKDLQDEKERLAVTLTSIAEGLIVTDTNGKIMTFNRAAEQLSGWTKEQVAGMLIDDVFKMHEGHALNEKEIYLFNLVKTAGEAVLIHDGSFVDKKGKKKLINSSASSIMDEMNQLIGFIFVFRDITEIKKVEEELLRHRQIESIGILAGGIAHDFNNLLTGILGNISIVKHSIGKGSKEYERLIACEKASNSAKNLTQQLLTFSRGGAPVKKIVELDKFLEEVITFALSGSRIKGIFKFSDGLWPVEVDEGLFSQAINNVVINAIHSMPEGGTLNVGVENFKDQEMVFSTKPRRYTKIVLRDDGCGISSQNLTKIFDPYFTTKTSGSGLGLATTYSIINKHNGHIRIDSKIEKGTSVTILLPVIDTAPKTVRPEKIESKKQSLGKILLMDDEELIRDVGSEILEMIGFSVETVSNGEQAVQSYKEAKENNLPFNAVIMDLTIPGGMGGKETVEILKKLDPEVKAIVSSGYSNDPIMADFKDYGFDGVVAKPYRVEEMKSVLQEMLGPLE